TLTWPAPQRTRIRTRLVSWALDPRASDASRCLAASALSHPGLTPRRDERKARTTARIFREDLLRIASQTPAAVRACVAEALLEHGADGPFEMLLSDADARVRAASALATVG